MSHIAIDRAANQPLINQISGKQAASAVLSAVAGAGAAGDRLTYYTASDSAALTTLTAFARTLLDDTDAIAAANTLGAIRTTAASFTSPGYLRLGISPSQSFMIQWGSGTVGASTTDTITYPQAYSTFSICVVSGGSSSPASTGGIRTYAIGTSGASISNSGTAASYFWISVGV
jgi:hypothetical protein